MAKDYYKILQVARNASKDEVKKAYRKLAHQHHPDKDGGNEALGVQTQRCGARPDHGHRPSGRRGRCRAG